MKMRIARPFFPTSTTGAWLLCILGASLVLNLWGINFGLPEGWHPDEIVGRAVAMARNRTLNPHAFGYGSLHYYLTLSVIVPTYLITDVLSLPEETQKTAVYLAARGLSAVLGTSCVALTFCLSRHLFGPVAAIASSLLLALTMGFVNIAHFATVDIPMLFWMLASLLTSAYAMTYGGRRWYILAGVFAGCAAGTKYLGGSVIFPLFVAHILREGRRDHIALFYGIVAAAVAFIIVNPVILFSSCEFLNGFIKNNAWNAASQLEDPLHLRAARHVYNIYRTTGLLPSILIVAALGYSLFLIWQKSNIRGTFLLYSMIVLFALMLLMTHYNGLRYTMPLIPLLLILGGKMLSDLVSARNLATRRAAWAVAVVVVVYSGIYTIAGNLEIANDARNLVVAWVERNAASGAKIEATTYSVGPSRGAHHGAGLPEDKLRIVTRPHMHDAQLRARVAEVEQSAIYRALHPVYLRYASFAEAIGLCDDRRPYYKAWYEQHLSEVDQHEATFDRSISGLELRAPDYLVLSSFYYDRFEGDTANPEGRFFSELFGDASAYRQVAEIRYRALPFAWLDPDLEFINPTILIYQRQRPPAPAGPTAPDSTAR